MMRTTKTKVVVIGAGIAGITAAAKLINNGIHDVVVLEAQDYVGGRCKGQNVDDNMIDMGAMYIHGQEGNPMYEIAKKLGKTIEWENHENFFSPPEFFYTSKKEKVPFKRVEDLIKFIQLRLGETTDGKSKGHVLTNAYNEYLQLHHDVIHSDPSIKECYDAAFRWYCVNVKVDEGSNTLNDISVWADSNYRLLKGNNYTCIQGGFTTIIDALQKLIPADVIRTQTVVNSINWDETNSSGCVQVTCANGDVVEADHVISTISLGCLKATHSTVFSPPLPSSFVRSIQCMNMGAIGKIYLRWDKPFWHRDMESKEFLWLESQPVSLQSDKSKLTTSLGVSWWQDIAGLETVSEQDNVLLIWMLKHQMNVVNTLDEAEVKAVLHELIQTFVYDVDIPEPTEMYKTEWVENEFVRGTYSYIMPNFDPVDLQHLTNPIPSTQDPKLLFAGEAFTLEYMTTTHGAFISGEQQADKVLQANHITETVNVVDLIKE